MNTTKTEATNNDVLGNNMSQGKMTNRYVYWEYVNMRFVTKKACLRL